MINKERQWNFLQKLDFERVSGSAAEKRAAQIICRELETENIRPVIEEFTVEKALTTGSLTAGGRSYEVSGYGFCDYSSVTAPLYFFQSPTAVSYKQAENRIVMVNNGLTYQIYKELLSRNVRGIITFNGELRDSYHDTDLEHRSLRPSYRKLGTVPMVNMRVHDAFELVRSKPEEVTITVKGENTTAVSRNVIAEIPGTEYLNQVITFTAHFDSVEYSHGVFDNGAGDATLMEIFHHFCQCRPKRTLRFIFCGSEEVGLLGSKNYVETHKNDLKNVLFSVNVDVGAPLLSFDRVWVTASESVRSYLEELSMEKGFPLKTDIDIYSSDNIPFGNAGIAAVSFSRSRSRGTSYMHSRYDRLFFLDEEPLAATTGFIIEFVNRLANSKDFPLDTAVPENLREKITAYLNER